MSTKYKLPKIEELLESGVHFGHQVRRWHPKMEPYIYTVKKNIHIIDLEKTEEGLKSTCEFLYEVAKKGGQIIFVGTKKQARDIIEIEARNCGALHVTERWIGGTISNFKIIRKNIDKLLTFIKRKETGDLDKYTKKERLLIDREIIKLQRNIGGIVALKGTPAAVFVIDPKREKTAVREAKAYKVPVCGLVDTNSDPSVLNYVIAGNDDAIKSVALILKTISNAVTEGYKEYERIMQDNEKAAKEEAAKEKEAAEVKIVVAEEIIEEVAKKLGVDDLPVKPSIDNTKEVASSASVAPKKVAPKAKPVKKEAK